MWSIKRKRKGKIGDRKNIKLQDTQRTKNVVED